MQIVGWERVINAYRRVLLNAICNSESVKIKYYMQKNKYQNTNAISFANFWNMSKWDPFGLRY